MILLDTNVISELVKAEPDRGVVAYVDRIDPDVLFTAAICEAEIRYGLARMPTGRRSTAWQRGSPPSSIPDFTTGS
jgi:hypothetical protein